MRETSVPYTWIEIAASSPCYARGGCRRHVPVHDRADGTDELVESVTSVLRRL